MLVGLPADLAGVGDVGEALVGVGLEVPGQVAARRLERRTRPCRGDEQMPASTGIAFFFLSGIGGGLRRLLEDRVCVGPGDPEAVEAGTRRLRTLGPVAQRRGNLQRQLIPGDLGVGILQMKAGRDFPVAKSQRHLDQTRDPRGRF